MSKTLKEKTVHSVVWSFLDKFGQQGLSFIVWIILLRYFLSPEEYGLFALIAIFNALGYVLIDSGFSNALIRKQDVTQTDLSSVFYFNVVLSVLIYLMIFFCAPLIATFYKQPVLVSLVRVTALSIPLNSLILTHITLLSKAIDFKRLAISNTSALFCSGSLSLFLAWQGFGVWVLVIQPLSYTFVRIICLWSVCSWRPKAVFSMQSIKNLWGYSSKLLASSLLTVIFNNIYANLIGVFYPLKQVGYFSQANKISELSYITIIPAIHTPLYSSMAKIADDPERLKNAFRKTIRVAAFVFLPVMMGLITIAEPLIKTVVGLKWLPIVPYLQVLCVGYIFIGMAAVYGNVLYIKGASSKLLKFNIFYRSLLLTGVLLTASIGVLSIVICWSAAGIIYAISFALYAGKQIQYTVIEQIKDILPYFILALLMGIGVFLLSFFIHNSLILVSTQIITGASFYLGATYLLGSKIFREVVEILKRKLG